MTTSDAKVSAVHLGYSNDALFARQLEKFDDPKKDDNTNAKIRVVYDNWSDLGGSDPSLVLVNEDLTVNIDLSPDNRQTNYTTVDVYGEYE